jgi:soluble lytic murein transglycosylase-like protein
LTLGRALLVGFLAAASTALVPAASLAQTEITAFVESTGRVVFTNMAAAPPVSTPARDLRQPTVPDVPYAGLIEAISGRHGVDPTLVRAVIEVESAYNPDAVSSKDARGLMQLIPETGWRFGVRDFFNPQQNIDGGVRYLRFLLDKFGGDMDLSLAAYNSGENRVERLGRIPSIPETVHYVRKVRAAIARMGGVAFPLGVTPNEASPAMTRTASAANSFGENADGQDRLTDIPIAGTIDAHGVRTFSNLNGY